MSNMEYFKIPNDFSTIRIIPIEGYPLQHNQIHRIGRLFPRYVYFVVVRGKEDEGVKLFYISRTLHEIINGIGSEEKVPIPLSWSKKLLQWLLNKLRINWKLNKYTDVLDLQYGYDFRISCKIKHNFPDYRDSYFIKKPCPVGTKSQIAEWLKQIESMTADEQCAVTMMRA